jgi:hypothetical protein
MAVRLSALHAGLPLPPRMIPGTHFYYRLSRHQGHSAPGRIRSIGKIHLIGTRTRGLPACGIMPQPITLPRAPTREVPVWTLSGMPTNRDFLPSLQQNIYVGKTFKFTETDSFKSLPSHHLWSFFHLVRRCRTSVVRTALWNKVKFYQVARTISITPSKSSSIKPIDRVRGGIIHNTCNIVTENQKRV